jgi:hypothetical protein
MTIKKSGTGHLVIQPEVLDIAYYGPDRFVVDDLSPTVAKTIKDLYRVAEIVQSLAADLTKAHNLGEIRDVLPEEFLDKFSEADAFARKALGL